MSTFLPDQILAIAPAELAQQSGDALFEIKNSAALCLSWCYWHELRDGHHQHRCAFIGAVRGAPWKPH